MEALLHHPLAHFLLQAVLIIGCARLVGLVARRLGQPMVIAEIVAGIMLGPSLLGLVAPDVMNALFPRASLGLLGMMSQVGLIVFMFLIGLELDPKLLRGKGRASVAISHTSIVVPFGLGGLLALYLYPRVSTPDVPFSSFALFMGVAMSITAFPVLARILSERRLLQSKIGAITITCAAVDDVTAWCLLAFVVSLVRATNVFDAIWTTVFALAYVAAMFYIVRPFLRRLGDRTGAKEGLSQNVVGLTLVMVLASSIVTEFIGIHALFGAFMVGAIMPKEGGFAQALAERLEDLVVVFLLPLFFAFSGLRTQIGLLDTAYAWAMCGLVILVACVGKFGGSAIAARLTGLSWRESGALGILMNTRGLMELIVLNIGLDLGVISPTLFTMMVLMALVTTFITTPLLQWVYPPTELAKVLADAPDSVIVPLEQRPFTVVMCVSFEQSGPPMVTLSSALAGDATRGKLYALKLIAPTERASFHMLERKREPTVNALAPLVERASSLNVRVRPLSFVSARPAADICNVAEVKRADLVVLGWHKPLLGKTVLGGTVHEVMENAKADVAVLIDRGLRELTKILVPYQGTIHDKAALRLAQRICKHAKTTVTILHVVSPSRPSDAPRLGVASQVQQTFEQEDPTLAGRVIFSVAEHTNPARAAVAEAGRGYDLVIVGAGQEWGLEHRIFGLQPETIIQDCPTSLLVVRQYEPEREPVSARSADAGPSKFAPVTPKT